ncbi:MAG: thymidine phosphorylase [Negativicoccus succinicivorans]|nr:thymidine phosphorylase [Negativicoccus succinicivorans]
MDALAMIRKARLGEQATADELKEWVQACTVGEVPDYQMAAWLMAVYFQGLTKKETTDLTLAMEHSGKTFAGRNLGYSLVDKHSTGGVADTTTLIVAPLAAACGAHLAKMSGRGLGFTGGTLDKLESIPGFQVQLTEAEFIRQVDEIGLAVIGQSAELAPADGIFYALRDVTETVESMPLIAASVMSKKLAAGADGIVLDVKCGAAAFMHNRKQAKALAQLMVDIGEAAGRKMTAFVTDMNVPLGSAIGNSLEVDEAVEVLSGGGNQRLVTLSLHLTAALLLTAGVVETLAEGLTKARQAIADGSGLQKFTEWIAAQGGETAWIGQEPVTKKVNTLTVNAPQAGYLAAIDALALAGVALSLGAGRRAKGDRINSQVGIRLCAEPGAYVEKNTPLARLYGAKNTDLDQYAKRVERAFTLQQEKIELPLIYEVLSHDIAVESGE